MSKIHPLPPLNVGHYIGCFIGGGALHKIGCSPNADHLREASIPNDVLLGYFYVLGLSAAKHAINEFTASAEIREKIFAGLTSWCEEQAGAVKSVLFSIPDEVYSDLRDCYQIDSDSPRSFSEMSELQFAFADYLFQTGAQTQERAEACSCLAAQPLNILWKSIWENVVGILKDEGCSAQLS